MLVIFGIKTVGKTISQGSFHFDRCQQGRSYKLKQNRHYFSLFFLPIIPLNKVGDTLECTFCKTAYIPNLSIIADYSASLPELEKTAAPLASYIKRIGAYIIDIVFLCLLTFPLSFLAVALQAYLPANFVITFYSVWIIYFFIMEWLLGGTIGKKIVAVETISDSENLKINALKWFLRALVKSVPFISIVALFNKNRKGVHDFVAGTIVVETKITQGRGSFFASPDENTIT